MRFPRISLLFILLLSSVLSVFAQSANGNISGLVLDPANRVITGAQVIAVNDVTGVQFTAQTNSEGVYSLPNLPPGPYRLQVSKPGFKTIIKPDIVLSVLDALSMNFTLPVGAALETVTVQGGAPLVNTQDASVSTVIDRQLVESLPLNGRSFNTLLQLTPGVVIAPASQVAPGQFNIAGQRAGSNNFLVDGVSANFGVLAGHNLGQSGTGAAQAFSALGGTNSLISVEALQEFRIETSSFAPEFGRSSGGQVVLTSRSGTNDVHGGVYDYFRNEAMDANDWFANHVGNPRAPERHNDFGAFLGGPIQRNRSFFFFSYEGARLTLPRTTVTQVPSRFARSVAPAAVAPYLYVFPLPNQPESGTSYTAPFIGTYASSATLNATSIRIDHNFSQSLKLFGRYNEAPSDTVDRCCSLNNVQSNHVITRTLTLDATMTVGPNLSNTLLGNYSMQRVASSYSLDRFGGGTPADISLLVGNLAPATNQGEFDAFDSTTYTVGPESTNKVKQFNVADHLAVTRGAHALKFGGDYRALFLSTVPYQHYTVLLATSIKNLVTTGEFSYMSTGTEASSQFLVQAMSLYGQDTWRVKRSLTMTYGVRWELNPAPEARGATRLAAWTGVDTPASLALAPEGTPLWRTTYADFAPRVGVAYSPGKADLVFRAGFGLFYDIGGGGSAAQLASAFPNLNNGFFAHIPLPLNDVSQYLPTLSLDPPYSGTVQGFSPKLRLPVSYQWNLAVEKSLLGKQTVTATYVGQAGRRLLRQEAFYKPNSNFASDFQLTTNGSLSNYNALELQFRRPLSSYLQALLNYTWSHSLDDVSNDVATLALPGSVLSSAKDYGQSSFDVRHSFSGAVIFNPPFIEGHGGLLKTVTKDWSFDAVIVARSGVPLNGVLVFASPDPGDRANSRPDLVPGQTFWLRDPDAPGGQRLNPNAFALPPTPRQGTEPRNDIPGFGLFQADLSAGRRFSLTDRLKLHFRADAFNFLNHPNFTNPLGYVEFGPAYLQSSQMLNQGLGGLNALFQEGGPRSIQLSLKLTF